MIRLGSGVHNPLDGNGGKKNKFSDLKGYQSDGLCRYFNEMIGLILSYIICAGENCKKSLEAMVKGTGKESFQWGIHNVIILKKYFSLIVVNFVVDNIDS